MPEEMHPIDPREACTRLPSPDDPNCSVAGSQAALILTSRIGVLGVTEREQADLDHAADLGGFGLPDLRGMRRERRLPVDQAHARLGITRQRLVQAEAHEVQSAMARAADALYRDPSPESAAALFETGLHSRHPLVRVAAATSARETTRLRPEILAELRSGVASPDSLVAALAETGMAQIRPNDPALLAQLVAPPGIGAPAVGAGPAVRSAFAAAPPAAPDPAPPVADTVLTHGTWGAEGDWYRPGGEFYTRLAAERPDLHLHDPSFSWSGGYSDAERSAAALQLVDWCAAEGLAVPDLFAHSHGGTVGSLATTKGQQLRRLVYMGWPVHAEWFPDPARVAHVIDIRVNLDLVILADRGGQRIRNAPFPFQEHVNGWFDHTSTREPHYWDAHSLWGVV